MSPSSKIITCESCINDNCLMKSIDNSWSRIVESEKIFRKFKKGIPIIQQGSVATAIYFIFEGKVKVFCESSGGIQQIIRFAGNGEMVGHRIFGSSEHSSISAETLEDSKVCIFSIDTFHEIVRANSQVALQLLNFLSEELRKSDQVILKMSRFSIRQRIADALLRIIDSFGFEEDGRTISFSVSRKDLAKTVASVPEVVSRNLAELSKSGVIRLAGKQIVIPDLEKLKAEVALFA